MKDLCTADEIAERTGVHVRTVHQWAKGGFLPKPLSLFRRSPHSRTADIDAWIKNGCKPAQLKAYKRKRRGGTPSPVC